MKCKNLTALYYRTSLISMLFNLVLFSLICVCFAISQNNNYFYYGVLLTFIVLFPFISYFLYKNIYYQLIKLTDIQEVRLQNVIHGRSKKFVGFSITLKVDGLKIKRGTKHIFTTSAGKLCVSDFKEKDVLVGYNKKTDEVVVIGLEGEE